MTDGSDIIIKKGEPLTPEACGGIVNAAAGMMRWKHPEIAFGTPARERAVAWRITRTVKVDDECWPDAHEAWLTIGPQHFHVGLCEDEMEAGFMCVMLAKAMIAMIDGAASGELPHGPPVLG